MVDPAYCLTVSNPTTGKIGGGGDLQSYWITSIDPRSNGASPAAQEAKLGRNFILDVYSDHGPLSSDQLSLFPRDLIQGGMNFQLYGEVFCIKTCGYHPARAHDLIRSHRIIPRTAGRLSPIAERACRFPNNDGD